MNDIQEIEISIEAAKEAMAKGEAVRKLSSNRDFKRVILDGLFKDEAARLVGLIADPAMKEHRNDIIEMMIGISTLQSYLRNTMQMGRMAGEELVNLEEAADDVRNEALAG